RCCSRAPRRGRDVVPTRMAPSRHRASRPRTLVRRRRTAPVQAGSATHRHAAHRNTAWSCNGSGCETVARRQKADYRGRIWRRGGCFATQPQAPARRQVAGCRGGGFGFFLTNGRFFFGFSAFGGGGG